MDGTTILGMVTLSAGKANLPVTALSVGNHTITVVYNGGANYYTSSSTGLPVVVNHADTTIAIKASPKNSKLGQPVTFTVTVKAVAPGAGTPTGTVTFMDGTTPLGTTSLIAGAADFTTATLSLGTHAITAIYNGDSNFTTGTSSALTQTVK